MRPRVDGPGYFEGLLQQALKAEISTAEFWLMTPKETFMSIEAYVWRRQAVQREAIKTAWLTANLTRAKRLPPLARLLTEKKAKVLAGPELEKRRREFADMSDSIDLEAINEQRAR